VKTMANLDDLLEKTSRTFALSIPMLPEPTRRHVAIAYLLFRVADTFEDAVRWPRAERLAALDELDRLLTRPGGETQAADPTSAASRNPGAARAWMAPRIDLGAPPIDMAAV